MSVYPGGRIVTTPDRRRGDKVEITPDPRISNLRPGWLADDQQWRDQLQALELDEDIRWVERHWDMAGGREPAVDTSWITFETIGGGWSWVPVLGLFLLVALVVAAGMVDRIR